MYNLLFVSSEKVEQFFRGAMISLTAGAIAFIDHTMPYIFALLIGFTFNILAGFRADEVKIEIRRIIPPILLKNFNGNKFKDALFELFLITLITYVLKLLVDLMNYKEHSAYVVQFLIAIALYFYFRNGLRNLSKVYPDSKWLKVLYVLISFKFKELVGADVSSIIENIEKEKNDIKK